MKKLVTISLFIFWAVVVSLMTAGLVFYQNSKNTSTTVAGSKVDALTQAKINQLNSTGKSLVLDMAEIKKHNRSSDCWMIISGNVYDITSFFGSHPGGNANMAATCGTDATDAYMTKDPNATSTAGGQDHSSRARAMLNDYYLGALNQSVGQQTVDKVKAAVPAVTIKGGENEYDD